MDKEENQERFDKLKEQGDASTWAHDQQKRDYYYDDSTGYETYDPNQEDDEDDTVADQKSEEQKLNAQS